MNKQNTGGDAEAPGNLDATAGGRSRSTFLEADQNW